MNVERDEQLLQKILSFESSTLLQQEREKESGKKTKTGN